MCIAVSRDVWHLPEYITGRDNIDLADLQVLHTTMCNKYFSLKNQTIFACILQAGSFYLSRRKNFFHQNCIVFIFFFKMSQYSLCHWCHTYHCQLTYQPSAPMSPFFYGPGLFPSLYNLRCLLSAVAPQVIQIMRSSHKEPWTWGQVWPEVA